MFFQLFEQMTLHKFGQVCVKPANHSGIFFTRLQNATRAEKPSDCKSWKWKR